MIQHDSVYLSFRIFSLLLADKNGGAQPTLRLTAIRETPEIYGEYARDFAARPLSAPLGS